MLQPQHQQNGSGNVQQDHADSIGHVSFGQRFNFLPLPTRQTVKKQPDPCAKIQKGSHHGSRDLVKQELAQGDIGRIERGGKERIEDRPMFRFHVDIHLC